MCLFGSRARGDNRPDSDYDLCILAPEDMGMIELGGFYGKLEEALGENIDVICEEGMSDEFRRMISNDMRLVYGERRRPLELLLLAQRIFHTDLLSTSITLQSIPTERVCHSL